MAKVTPQALMLDYDSDPVVPPSPPPTGKPTVFNKKTATAKRPAKNSEQAKKKKKKNIEEISLLTDDDMSIVVNKAPFLLAPRVKREEEETHVPQKDTAAAPLTTATKNASYAEVVTGRISPTPQGTSKLTGGILASEHARVQPALITGPRVRDNSATAKWHGRRPTEGNTRRPATIQEVLDPKSMATPGGATVVPRYKNKLPEKVHSLTVDTVEAKVIAKVPGRSYGTRADYPSSPTPKERTGNHKIATPLPPSSYNGDSDDEPLGGSGAAPSMLNNSDPDVDEDIVLEKSHQAKIAHLRATTDWVSTEEEDNTAKKTARTARSRKTKRKSRKAVTSSSDEESESDSGKDRKRRRKKARKAREETTTSDDSEEKVARSHKSKRKSRKSRDTDSSDESTDSEDNRERKRRRVKERAREDESRQKRKGAKIERNDRKDGRSKSRQAKGKERERPALATTSRKKEKAVAQVTLPPKKKPDGAVIHLQKIRDEVRAAFRGFVIVDISAGEGRTEAGYRLTSKGMNNREVTADNVNHLWDGTNDGKTIHCLDPEHTMIVTTSVKEFLPTSFSTDAAGGWKEFQLKEGCDAANTIDVHLVNGGHRRVMMTERKRAPLVEERRQALMELNNRDAGTASYDAKKKDIARLDSEIDQCSYWLTKCYDLDMIFDSPNAQEIIGFLSTNIRPNTVDENEDNTIWKIADLVASGLAGSTRADVLARLRLQTMLHVSPGRKGEILRAITLNYDVMTSFALLSSYPHFRVRQERGHSSHMSREPLRYIALHTSPLFLALIKCCMSNLTVMFSVALGNAPSIEDYEKLEPREREETLLSLISLCTAEREQSPTSFPGASPTLMKVFDDSFCATIQPIFLSHHAAHKDSQKNAAWVEACDKYYNMVCKATDKLDSSIRKRLYYVMKTQLIAMYPAEVKVEWRTVHPIFTHSMLHCWIQMFGPRESKTSGNWHGFRLLSQSVCGMIEFGAHNVDDSPTFGELIENIRVKDGRDITVQLLLLFLVGYADCWLPSCDLITANVEEYKKLGALPMKGHLAVLADRYNVSEADFKAFEKVLAEVLMNHSVEREDSTKRVKLDVDAQLSLSLPLLHSSLHPVFESVLNMLRLSYHEWYFYSDVSTTHARQAIATCLRIYNALGHSIILSDVCSIPLMKMWRHELMEICEDDEDRDRTLPFRHQWDTLENKYTDGDAQKASKTADYAAEDLAADTVPIERDSQKLKKFLTTMKTLMRSDVLPTFEGLDGEGVLYEEGVVTALKTLYTSVFHFHAKKREIERDPTVHHIDLDLKWATNIMSEMDPLTWEIASPSTIDAWWEKMAESLRNPQELPIATDDEDVRHDADNGDESGKDDKMGGKVNREQSRKDDREIPGSDEEEDVEEKEEEDDGKGQDKNDDKAAVGESIQDVQGDTTGTHVADLSGPGSKPASAPIDKHQAEIPSSPIQEFSQDTIMREGDEAYIEEFGEKTVNVELIASTTTGQSGGDDGVTAGTENGAACLPSASVTAIAVTSSSQATALLAGLKDCYHSLAGRLLHGTPTMEKWKNAEEDFAWLKEHENALTPALIRDSKIYKVIYRIARIDCSKPLRGSTAIIRNARTFSKKWEAYADLSTALIRAPLTPPTYSQQVFTQQETIKYNETSAMILDGWKSELSDQLDD